MFIIMEYIAGGDLFEHIQSFGPVGETRARAWFREIVCAVEFMHSNLVVHRDLKLENILLTPKNTIKITGRTLTLKRIVLRKQRLWFRTLREAWQTNE